MADHTIDITFNGTNFHGTDPKLVNKHDTIAWNLTGTGAAMNQVDKLKIKFDKDDNPFHPSTKEFDANAGQDTKRGVMAHPKQKIHNYSITAVLKNGHSKTQDPQIIFEDVVGD